MGKITDLLTEIKMSDIIKKGDKDGEKKAKEMIADMRKKGKSDDEIKKAMSKLISPELISKLMEAEMSSKSNTKLYKKVFDKVSKIKGSSDADFHLDLLKAMNPKKLSQSDIDTLNDLDDQY